MQKSKLKQVVNQLNSQDIRNLRKFLHSPFFNQRQDVVDLFEYLILEKESLEAEKVFTKLFPSDAFDATKLRLVMSYLFRQIEKYLSVAEFFENEETQKSLILSAYKKRNLPEQVRRTIKEGIIALQKKELRNAGWYNYNFQMQFEYFQLESADTPTAELNRQELSDTLDIAYLIAKLRQVCLLLSHKAIYKSEFDIGFLGPLIVFLKSRNFQSIPAIAVYFHCYFMLSEPDEERHFRTFKDLLLKKGTVFSTWEIRDLYLQAINYCIKRINDGEANYFEEVMDLYKEGLQKGYLLENGILSRFTYHNIVSAGLKTGDFEWVKDFIYLYKKNLKRKYRESSFSYSLAKLEYHLKNYDAALSMLQKSNYRDLLLNLGAKTLLLKIYYELDEYDLLEAHLEAMKNYIRRKRVIGYHQKNYRNIIQITRKLLSINGNDKLKMKALNNQIQNADPLTERDWLIDQFHNA